MEVIIDLDKQESIKQVTVGTLENQGPGIYFPTKVTVYVSNDDKKYIEVGNVERGYAKNASSILKDFVVDFKEQKVRFVKVIATSLKQTPKGGGVWLFVDEVLIE